MLFNAPTQTFTVLFDASEKTVTVENIGRSTSALITRIVNVTDNVEVFGSVSKNKGVQVRNVENNTLTITLDYDTTGMSDGDVIEVLMSGEEDDILFHLLDAKSFGEPFPEGVTITDGVWDFDLDALLIDGDTVATQNWVDDLLDNVTKNILFADGFGIDTVAGLNKDLIIGGANATTITIGHAGATVNILGVGTIWQATQSTIADSLITLNKGGGAGTAIGAGFEFEENNVITGYFKTNATRDGYSWKAPEVTYGVIWDMSAINTSTKTYTLPNTTGTIALTSQLATTTGLMKTAVALDATLRTVTDYAGTSSPISISTTQVELGTLVSMDFSNVSANNRFLFKAGTVGGSATWQLYSANALAGNGFNYFGASNTIGIGGAFVPNARVQVRGDGTNPVVRFESTSSLSYFGVSLDTSTISMNHAGAMTFTMTQLTGAAANADTSLILNRFSTSQQSNLRFNTASTNNWAIGTDSSSTGKTTSDLFVYSYSAGLYVQLFDYSTGTVTFTPKAFTNTSVLAAGFNISQSFTAGAGSANFRPLNITYTINNSGAQTGTASGIFLNATETALNGMIHYLLRLQVGGTDKFRVLNNGTLYTVLQTGNATLVTGQTYKDTAANILANGDYIMGIKA